MVMRRRGWLAGIAGLLAVPVAAATPPNSPPNQIERPSNIGQPLGRIELRVSAAKSDAFLQDLADFADYYSLNIWGQPAGLMDNNRPVLLVWFTRPDGLAVLVTDAAQGDRMQAFFYIGTGGLTRDHLLDVMHGYRNKMSGYQAYTKP